MSLLIVQRLRTRRLRNGLRKHIYHQINKISAVEIQKVWALVLHAKGMAFQSRSRWPISIKHTNQQIVRQQFKYHVLLLMSLKQMFCVTVSVASSCLIIEKRNLYLISKNLQYQISTITYIYTWIICGSKLQFKTSPLPLFNNPLRSQMARNC
mgnify:CR=1 FL=1